MRKALVSVLTIGLALACNKPARPTAFTTPRDAASALIQAASDGNVKGLIGILGSDGRELVASKDRAQDKDRAAAFAAKAHEKNVVEVDPRDPARATLVVGNDDWPLPIPIVEKDGKWYFDAAAGRDEILNRRIGENELAAITTCRGYVEAQKAYASDVHDDSGIHQYARRIISSPGKHDGLAWQNSDGTWGGPVAENAAKAIEKGYSAGQPYHGYYFKILEGQGPSAPLGKLDYLVDGAMIGGFALVAWPAEYAVTGVETFLVGYDGVVYQKDLGPETSKAAAAIDRYDPDSTWKRTDDAA
jgi:hypothetical protein